MRSERHLRGTHEVLEALERSQRQVRGLGGIQEV